MGGEKHSKIQALMQGDGPLILLSNPWGEMRSVL
jgi:hypothetical protein